MVLVVIAYFLQKKIYCFFDKNGLSNVSTLAFLGLLYCIVLLCLFLPESQTWMTSEGLNRQLLSMHFLI